MAKGSNKTQEAGAHGASSLYDEITDIVGFEKGEAEEAEDFKGRLVEEFSNQEVWPDDKYDSLPQRVKDWIYDATIEYKNNRNRKRKRNLPAMSGLDATPRTGRADINAPGRKTKEPKRQPGTDCVTRVMKELAAGHSSDADALVTTLKTKYDKEYSKAAVRYAIQAFNTAKAVIMAEAA